MVVWSSDSEYPSPSPAYKGILNVWVSNPDKKDIASSYAVGSESSLGDQLLVNYSYGEDPS